MQANIELREGDSHGDLEIWEWLAGVLGRLGHEGMSSDDSSVEGHETVYRVKILNWQRQIQNYLDIIDQQRKLEPSIYTGRGSKGVKRVRVEGYHSSTRDPVVGLPRSFYDDSWFREMENVGRDWTLHVSPEEFEWIPLRTMSNG